MKKKISIILALFLAGIALLITNVYQRDTKKPVALGQHAPGFEALDSVNSVKLLSSDYEGKVLFVNFWASWCQPCREEMPSIEALYKEMSNNNDFRMITILYKDSIDNALGYMKANGYTFPVYYDPEGLSSKNFSVTGVPETYLIDKKNILRKRVIGPADWNSPDEKGFIVSLVNE
ncbi:MAG: TlpA disulfide reductase family protein [Nitrospirota bacterium]